MGLALMIREFSSNKNKKKKTNLKECQRHHFSQVEDQNKNHPLQITNSTLTRFYFVFW